ncbi:MAG: hypothetical protein IJM09_03340 [Neisseriaceae bacterium]|nr:hypothetical protein [Neisseriaceae bacterium]
MIASQSSLINFVYQIFDFVKTRFILPLGKIFIDEINKGLRSNQTEVSASEAMLKQALFSGSVYC